MVREIKFSTCVQGQLKCINVESIYKNVYKRYLLKSV